MGKATASDIRTEGWAVKTEMVASDLAARLSERRQLAAREPTRLGPHARGKWYFSSTEVGMGQGILDAPYSQWRERSLD